jgi:hypothetical protein
MDAATATQVNALLAEGKHAEASALAQQAAIENDPHMKPRQAATKAKKAAGCCGRCGGVIAPGAPVWIGAVSCRGYYQQDYVTLEAPLCENCRDYRTWRPTRYFPPRPCENCKRPVHLRQTRRVRRVVCSDGCRKALYRAQYFRRKGSRARRCDVCGEVFTQTRSDAKTCSPACRQKAYRRRVTDTNESSTANS